MQQRWPDLTSPPIPPQQSLLSACKVKNSHFLGLATTDREVSLGSLGPSLLMAITRNSYSSPSSRLLTVASLLVPGTSLAFCHLCVPFLRFSTAYAVMGVPPSLSGGDHLRSTWSLSQSVGSGRPGLPGSSAQVHNQS